MNTSESTADALDFVKNFKKFLIGQPNAEALALDMIEKIQNPLRDRRRPIGVYAIIGPTGVGKTRTAKTLARLFHQDEEALIKIDCGDYNNQEHQMTDLKGAAPSYKGHVSISDVKKLKPDEVDATSRISPHNMKRVRRFSSNGINVIVLDEFEKGCEELYKFFMGIFDDGTCTFANGVEGDYSNTIFILTMNLGMGKAEQMANGGIGFNSKKRNLTLDELADIISKEMTRKFPPEFRNRLDGTLVYQNLNADQMLQVVDVEIADVIERIFLDLPFERQFALQVTKEACQFILDTSLDGSKEIRDLKRTIERMIVNKLGRELAKGTLEGGDLVTVRFNDVAKELVFHNLKSGGRALVENIRSENGYIDGAWSSDAPSAKNNSGAGKQRTRKRINGKTSDGKSAGDKSDDEGDEKREPPLLNRLIKDGEFGDFADESGLPPRFAFDLIGYGKHLGALQDEAETIQEAAIFGHHLKAPALLIEYTPTPLFIITVECTQEQVDKLAAEYPRLEVKKRYQL